MWSLLYTLLSLLLRLLHYVAVLFGWVVLVAMIFNVVLGPARFKSLQDRINAYLEILLFSDPLSKTFAKVKKELFSGMKDMKSADAEQRSKGGIRILEIGVGVGTNLPFFPDRSRLISIDPNPHAGEYFQKNCAQKAGHLSDVQFVVGRGEDMSSIESGSVDAVVVSLVLCTVQHVDSVLREVVRVLTPGGKFFFLEHIGDEEGTWRRRLQDVATHSWLWPVLFDGCDMNRRVQGDIAAAGFSQVDMHEVAIQDKTGEALPLKTHGAGGFFLNPILYGVATK